MNKKPIKKKAVLPKKLSSKKSKKKEPIKLASLETKIVDQQVVDKKEMIKKKKSIIDASVEKSKHSTKEIEKINFPITANGNENIPFISNGKLIKRKIKRKKPGTGPSKVYFTKDTQAAIVEYQQEIDGQIKEYIYVKKILPAFDSLIENLINVYGFKVQYDSKEDLKHEAMDFLYRTIPKYDHTKNTKAFSYFNVVGRNWLTIQSKQNAKKSQQYISLDDAENISLADAEKIESFNYIPAYDEIVKSKEMRVHIVKIIKELSVKSRTTNEKAVLTAVEDILTNIDNLEFLNKRALLIYVRELSKLSSKQLSMVLSNIKKQYKELKKLEEYNL